MARCSSILLFAHAVVFVLVDGSASAQQPARLGGEFHVNTYTPGLQLASLFSVDVEANGDFVVVWSSNGQDGTPSGVFGQRFSSAGAKLGPELQINAYTTDQQRNAAVAADNDGDFVVAWQSYGQDGSDEGVFARRFNSSGAALGGEVQVNLFTSGGQDGPTVGRDADGDFVVAWVSAGQDGSYGGVFARRFNSSGAALGGELQLNSSTSSIQTQASIDVDADGDFVAVWQGFGADGSSYGIAGQRFSSQGTKLGGELQINVYATGNQLNPVIGVDADNDFVVAWRSDHDGGLAGVFARRFSSSGTPRGAEFQVNVFTPLNQQNATVGLEPDGDFVVAWDSRDQDGDLYGIFARHFASSGVATGAELQVNTTTDESQLRPTTRSSSSGAFVVVWSSAVGDGEANYGVVGQRFEFATAVLDVDANGEVTPLTDGLLALRFLFGFTGTSLTSGATGPGCMRCDSASIVPYLQGLT